MKFNINDFKNSVDKMDYLSKVQDIDYWELSCEKNLDKTVIFSLLSKLSMHQLLMNNIFTEPEILRLLIVGLMIHDRERSCWTFFNGLSVHHKELTFDFFMLVFECDYLPYPIMITVLHYFYIQNFRIAPVLELLKNHNDIKFQQRIFVYISATQPLIEEDIELCYGQLSYRYLNQNKNLQISEEFRTKLHETFKFFEFLKNMRNLRKELGGINEI